MTPRLPARTVEMDETWHDLVRRTVRRPRLTDDDCDALLWQATCFPFGTPRQVRRTLRQSWGKGRKTVAGAVDWSYRELDRAMESLRP